MVLGAFKLLHDQFCDFCHQRTQLFFSTNKSGHKHSFLQNVAIKFIYRKAIIHSLLHSRKQRFTPYVQKWILHILTLC